MSKFIADLELALIAKTRSVNYLHLGNALDVLAELVNCSQEEDSLRHLRSRWAAGSQLAPLLRHLGKVQGKIRLSDLRRDVRSGLEWRKRFHLLSCRGFSYGLDTKMRGYNCQFSREYHLDPSVNIRVALIAREQLFYPAKVQKYLRRVPWSANHYFYKGRDPSIAICFGKKQQDAWFIFTMQSDLASHGPCAVREHFRGWRHVLFANLVAQASQYVSKIYLCPAQGVERGCHPGTKPLPGLSEKWKGIYDRTAEQWGMKLAHLLDPVDIQMYRGLEPVYVDRFYELRLEDLSNRSTCGQEDLCIERT